MPHQMRWAMKQTWTEDTNNAQKKMKKHGTNVFVDAGKNWDWPPLLTKELQFS